MNYEKITITDLEVIFQYKFLKLKRKEYKFSKLDFTLSFGPDSKYNNLFEKPILQKTFLNLSYNLKKNYICEEQSEIEINLKKFTGFSQIVRNERYFKLLENHGIKLDESLTNGR